MTGTDTGSFQPQHAPLYSPGDEFASWEPVQVPSRETLEIHASFIVAAHLVVLWDNDSVKRAAFVRSPDAAETLGALALSPLHDDDLFLDIEPRDIVDHVRRHLNY